MIGLWRQEFPQVVPGTLKHYLYSTDFQRFTLLQIWAAAGMCGDPALCQVACKGQLRKELITAETIRVHVAR